MKGSVLRLLWPAPAAANAATQPGKDQTRRQTTTPDLDAQGERPLDPFNEITLAVLEEFSAVKARGYDPYNTSAAARRLPADAGQRKRKRD